MSKIKNKIIESFKWKKNSKYCAKRLGINIEEYKKLKKQVIIERRNQSNDTVIDQKYDIDKGSATITAKSTNEPKTPEEIISLLKIDTNKWKLSQFWNKQMSDHWRVSALITKIKKSEDDHLKEFLENWEPKKFKITKTIQSNNTNKQKVCGIISLQDIHFGKQGNETIDADFEDTLINLISRGTAAHCIETLYFVVGGDLINMDTFSGTTTGGTPLDNCMNATAAYEAAFDAMHWAINLLINHCDNLVVVYIPGNHDRLSSFHLAHALSKSIECDQVTWDVRYDERKVHVWGDNFNAFEHGDKRSKNNPLIYASEYPKEWGNTTNRTLFKGHIHTDRKVEYMTSNETAGFVEKTLPSLGKTDYYHYSNKYVGNRRSGKLELQHPTMGNICELTHCPQELDSHKLF